MGIDQIANKSRVFSDAIQTSVTELEVSDAVLVIGAVGAATFVAEILNSNPRSRVSILDDDAEALRHLRHTLSRHGDRVKIVRGAPNDVSIVPEDRFGTILILWPRMSKQDLVVMTKSLKRKMKDHGKISIISWTPDSGATKFWNSVRRDLEKNREIDLVRWHLGIILEHSSSTKCVTLDVGTIIASGLAQMTEFS